MTFDATPPRAPIGALRMSSLAMAGVIVAVSVPVAVATMGMSTQVTDQQAQVPIRVAGPITRVVVDDSESDVQISGDPAVTGVDGQAVVQWKGKGGKRAVLRQSVAGGVLTLTKDCSDGACGPIDITLTVPASVSVQATSSNGQIVLNGVGGAAVLTTSNGGIEADGLGSANCSFKTTNGGIDASFRGAPSRITAGTTNADVHITTDGSTAYYDAVHVTNGTQQLSNVRDHRSPNEIDVTTANGDVTIS